jgi:hypothetical protein
MLKTNQNDDDFDGPDNVVKGIKITESTFFFLFLNSTSKKNIKIICSKNRTITRQQP